MYVASFSCRATKITCPTPLTVGSDTFTVRFEVNTVGNLKIQAKLTYLLSKHKAIHAKRQTSPNTDKPPLLKNPLAEQKNALHQSHKTSHKRILSLFHFHLNIHWLAVIQQVLQGYLIQALTLFCHFLDVPWIPGFHFF